MGVNGSNPLCSTELWRLKIEASRVFLLLKRESIYIVRSRRCRNRRIGEFLKELHLTEGRNTGFKKILDALVKNGSPLPEFETDEMHDYFITRLFVRNGFYDFDEIENITESSTENVTENVTENLPNATRKLLAEYSDKKRAKAIVLALAISSDSHITIEKMIRLIHATDRTVKRYLKEFQDAGALRRKGSDTSGEWLLM